MNKPDGCSSNDSAPTRCDSHTEPVFSDFCRYWRTVVTPLAIEPVTRSVSISCFIAPALQPRARNPDQFL